MESKIFQVVAVVVNLPKPHIFAAVVTRKKGVRSGDPMSRAEEREVVTAEANMSAARRPGAVSSNPKTSRSAVVSAIVMI